MADVTRRRFLAGSAAAAGLSLTHSWPLFADARPMPRRLLGRTGAKVSLAGFGGFQIGAGRLSDDDATKVVHRAMDLGVDYFDVAPSYRSGHSERKLGLALERDKRRDKVFLATKTQKRGKKAALKELRERHSRSQTSRAPRSSR